MYVDSHCHLDFPEFAAELPGLLDAMAVARVTHALCISVNLPDWPAVHALAVAHPNLYATVGVHPDAENTTGSDWYAIRMMFTSGCCSVSVSERTWQPARHLVVTP